MLKPLSEKVLGFFCAIGNCSSCLMVVEGELNVRTCVTKVKEGILVERQKGKGSFMLDRSEILIVGGGSAGFSGAYGLVYGG